MPIHFSIGFVTHGLPKKPVVSLCARLTDRVEVDAYWPRDDAMNCSCDDNGCIKPGAICAPQGDDVLVLFSVYDTDGDEYDVSGAAEIVFAVSDSVVGTNRFVKTLTDGGIVLSGNGYQVGVYIEDTDTAALVQRKNYYEIRVTTSDGLQKTISAGIFRAEQTMIKDIV